MEFTPSVENVISLYLQASEMAFREGMSWYNDAHEFARILDPENVERAAGVIAAISPNTSWTANKTLARKAYAQGNGEGIGFPDKNAKVTRILNGENPLDVLGGPKVRAFYATILDPTGDHSPVIDRHAFDIAIGKRTDEKSRGMLGRKGVYDQFSDVYREAARLAGIGTAQMQAITWVAWRALHSINV